MFAFQTATAERTLLWMDLQGDKEVEGKSNSGLWLQLGKKS